MSKETWTPADEQLLAELNERKQRVDQQQRQPVVDLLSNGCPHVFDREAPDVANWMMANADTLRDLLQPFDSGVRPQKVES